jgi:hypothetical protein
METVDLPECRTGKDNKRINWRQVAKLMGRNSTECNYAYYDAKKKVFPFFNEEEVGFIKPLDEVLIVCVNCLQRAKLAVLVTSADNFIKMDSEIRINWKRISALMGRGTPLQCSRSYQAIVSRQIRENHKEDEELTESDVRKIIVGSFVLNIADLMGCSQILRMKEMAASKAYRKITPKRNVIDWTKICRTLGKSFPRRLREIYIYRYGPKKPAAILV